MPGFSALPDAEAVVGWWLRSKSVASGRVYSSIPTTPTFPLIVVERVGGSPAVRERLDRARIQLSIWGNSKSEARDLADAARLALLDLEGQSVLISNGAPVNAFVTAVEDDLSLFWSPDPVSDRDRYIFGVAIFDHVL
jgi:hypothetical protein